MKKLFVLWLTLLLTVVSSGSLQATSWVQPPVPAATAKNLKSNNQKLAAKYRTTLLDRFLKYVTYDSKSKEDELITENQIKTAQKLFAEIEQMGLNVTLSEHYYIFVDIPSNLSWQSPILGFSCHYDVTPDVQSEGVKPQRIDRYDGNKIELGINPRGELEVLDPDTERDAYLKTQIGNTIVTSDGTTNLGADDKAGVAIVMTFLETLAQNPAKKHGPIQVVIAPNEDVGRAAQFIDEIPYRPEIAFDFDGGVDGQLMIENFEARQEFFTVKGRPGHQSAAATNGYRNAWTPACELGATICTKELLPNNSSGRQGYAELHHISHPEGDVSTAKLDIRLRGYVSADMDKWSARADSIAKEISKLYDVQITHESFPSYSNVGEHMYPQALELTKRAFEMSDVKMNAMSVRAGTTAAMFVTKGLVGAYTIFTGQNNEHLYSEWLSEEDMYKSYVVALNLADVVAQVHVAK